MKIDLCELFGVEEGEEFKIDHRECVRLIYKVKGNALMLRHEDEKDYWYSDLGVNTLSEIKNIIKLPKKKQFTDNELCILRNIDKEYKWIARDDYSGLAISNEDKPYKTKIDGIRCWYSVGMVTFMFEHLFQSIQWEDEEPVFIDDYVERN